MNTPSATSRKFVVAVTGASGAIYAQRLLEILARAAAESGAARWELHLVLSSYARQVASEELGELVIPPAFTVHGDRSMNAPFASGSTHWDAMVIVPCSMGTIGRIAHGYSDSLITRSADVFLKEKRKLIVVPRETPWHLLQARNIVSLLEAGALVLPAMPSFYGRPQTVQEVADTVVARILDHLEVPHQLGPRWKEGEPAPVE